MLPLPLCVRCDEPIGVYEPAVVVDTQGVRRTSLLREPDLARDGGTIILHASCASEQLGPLNLRRG